MIIFLQLYSSCVYCFQFHSKLIFSKYNNIVRENGLGRTSNVIKNNFIYEKNRRNFVIQSSKNDEDDKNLSIFDFFSLQKIRSSQKVRRVWLAILLGIPIYAFGGMFFSWLDTRYIAPPVDPTYGYDLYGRIPHDDYLFTTERLINPDLLKPTLIESVGYRFPFFLSFI
jgi:hypothetical protein